MMCNVKCVMGNNTSHIPHFSFHIDILVGLMFRILLTVLFLGAMAFAHETDSLFVPPKPEKPLRY